MSRESIIQQTLDDTINNQDFMQRVYMSMSVTLELYRMLVSSLLILFIPQNCNGHLCSLKENLVWQDNGYNVSLTFNFITLFAFVILYGVEIVRENRMISYLEVNPETPRDNKSVASILENLPEKYHKEIYSADYIYQKTSCACLLVFIINTILSGITVYRYNYGNQTTTTFITNVLFMTTKVYSTYYVANTDKSIFYSAYLHDRVQYNDIDRKIKTDIEKGYLFSNQKSQKYIELKQLIDPVELFTNKMNQKENLLNESSINISAEQGLTNELDGCDISTRKDIEEDDTKDNPDYSETDSDDIELPLGFPLEFPTHKNQVELEIDFPLDKTFIDLPNEVEPEYPNKEIVDLLRESVTPLHL
jgi:FtsH-binding integral membrane protein